MEWSPSEYMDLITIPENRSFVVALLLSNEDATKANYKDTSNAKYENSTGTKLMGLPKVCTI